MLLLHLAVLVLVLVIVVVLIPVEGQDGQQWHLRPGEGGRVGHDQQIAPGAGHRDGLFGRQVAVGDIVHHVDVREEAVLVRRGDGREQGLPSGLVGMVGTDQQGFVRVRQVLHGTSLSVSVFLGGVGCPARERASAGNAICRV
ncbi:hypothetical protein OG795_31755 [[Kitasatospora] papulosa]